MSPLPRILHLEDSSRDAQLIQDLLENADLHCDIVVVSNRRAFEQTLEREDFDLVLCDNNLNGYNGVEALEHVRRTRPQTPVVFISGSISEEQAVKCLRLGAVDYLLKQRLERLVPAVRRALEEADKQRQLRTAESDLRRSEERMRLALAATNDAVWDWDLGTGRMVCNETFHRVFGMPVLGRSPREWWIENTHDDDRDSVRTTLLQAIESGEEFWSASYRLRRSDGNWAHVYNRAYLTKNASGSTTRLVGAVQDVTARIEAERERRALEEQLQRSQKMEAIGTLAGGIAHDFNNILGIILANTTVAKTMLPELVPPEHEVLECLDDILLATDRAREMVKQILTFSRRNVGTRTAVDVAGIVRECCQLLRATIPAMVQLDTSVAAKHPVIRADATQLHQVIMNLCTNAWHALPDQRGRIDVVVDDCRIGPDSGRAVADLAPGDYVRLAIVDNGHGMSAEVQARIFEPFFTTKEVGRGTGLGLSVVHGIVKSHGGAIVVESELNRGTTFHLYFPRHVGDSRPTESVARRSARRGHARVLVVDDERSMARATQRVLEQRGFNVAVEINPVQALKTVRDAATHFDLIVTDYSMPELTGIELAGQILRECPGVPVILASGLLDATEVAAAHAAGIRAVLAKPVSPEALLSAVEAALENQPPSSPP